MNSSVIRSRCPLFSIGVLTTLIVFNIVSAAGSPALVAHSEPPPASASTETTAQEPAPASLRMSVIAPPVHIAAVGDIACEPPYVVTDDTCQHAATARLISSRSVDAVVPLGDTQYESGRLADYQASYDPSWGVLNELSYPVIGNHEYRDPGAEGFLSYFGARVPNQRVWYAENLGAWRVYVLNSNCDQADCAAQARWLQRDLTANPRRCSLAAMHHPRFSSGEHGNSAWAARFWPTLDSHQVDLVLAGHDHDYERFAPRHNSGAIAADGLRSFVVGTGGKSLYPFKETIHGSRSRYAAGAGALFLTLRDGSYTWRFRTTDGTVLDSGTASCLR